MPGPGLTGTTLGRYRLLERLGRGGMSEVYLAYDGQMNRNVALKVVGSTHTDYIERFHREAEAIARLNHSHILPAFDYGEQTPWHYLVMPYIEYGTLRDRLEWGPLTLEDAGEMLSQVADALQFAHDQGIVHRDIKPSNILLRDEHYVYLADFGLAKSLEGGDTLTQTGSLLGTPEYMAPELAEGPATTSSDVYALGILLYQMLTGQVPFSGETPVAVYWKQLRDQPPRPTALNPEIPPAVERVILHALEKDPRQRYPTAAALSHAYARALSRPSLQEERQPHSSHPHMNLSGEDISFSSPTPVQIRPSPLSEERLVLPSDPMIAPSASEPQRRRVLRRTVSQAMRRRSRRMTFPTPAPMEPLTPVALSETAFQQSSPDVQDLSAWHTPSVPMQRPRQGMNSVAITSLVLLGFVVILAIPFTFFYYGATAQQKSAAATAVANATVSAHAAQVEATQQAQVTATAGVAATATSGILLLADTLASNTNSRWPESASCVFENGAYHVLTQPPSSFQSCASSTLPLTSVTLQVDITLLSGNTAGLLCRMNGQQYYDFEITDAGEFFFRRHSATQGGSFFQLIEKQKSSAIVANQTNTLLLIAKGDDFKLYINRSFVGEVRDTALAYGQIGFASGTPAASTSGEAIFANLKVFRA